MFRIHSYLIAALVLATSFPTLGLPTLAEAQNGKAGVVTTLEGTVTARRVASAQPIALKFRDDVFLQDRIATSDRSLARLLLGDKAIVTVRERSVFTVSESPGRSTVGIESGKLGIAVARERMKPGEQIEIRTPSAIVAVRGTVLVVDVPDIIAPAAAGAASRGSAASGASAAPPAENVFVLRGSVEARIRATPGGPLGPPLMVNALQVLSVRGGVGTIGSFTPQQVGAIVSGLRASAPQFKDGANREETKMVAKETTAALVNALVGPAPGGNGGDGHHPLGPPPPPPGAGTPELGSMAPFVPPLIPGFTPESIADVTGAVQISGFRLLAPGERLFTFNGVSSRNALGPVASLTGAEVLQHGGDDLFAVQAGADATLAGPLAVVLGSTVAAGGNFLDVAGKLTSTSGQPFLRFNPSVLFAPLSFIRVGVGGDLTLSGQLVSDVSSTFVTPGDFLSVSGRLTSTTTSPLLQFNGSAVAVGASGSGSFFTLGGPSANVSMAGAGLLATNSTFVVGGAGFVRLENGAQLTSTGTAPWASFEGGVIDLLAGVGSPISLQNASASFGGGLLRAAGVADPAGGGSPSLAPMVGLTASSLSAGGTLVDLEGVDFEFPNTFLVALGSGSTLTVGSAPLLRMTGADLDTRELLAIDPTSQIVLNGPLADVSGSSLTSLFDLVPAKDGARIVSTSAAPLLALNSSTLVVGDAVFGIRGRSGQVTTEVADGVTLTVGTDRPITHGGIWLDAGASTITAQRVLALDTALLEASAPLLRLRPGSTFSTSVEPFQLTTTAKLTSVGPLLALDASTLSVGSGAVVNVAGTSLLRVTGDLFSLANGSTLRTFNGPLVRVGGNSVLNVTGALAVFSGTGGNTLNVTNSLCGSSCFSINGIPLHFVNGASSANVTIGPNPLKNPGLGSLVTSGPATAAILLDGPNSRVTITAP